MKKLEEKRSRNVTVTNELGLHARAAAMIAKLARDALGQVWLIRGKKRVDAASVIDILTLGCLKGTRLTARIENQADLDILENIKTLFENRFGE